MLQNNSPVWNIWYCTRGHRDYLQVFDDTFQLRILASNGMTGWLALRYGLLRDSVAALPSKNRYYPERSVINYHSTLRKMPKQRRSLVQNTAAKAWNRAKEFSNLDSNSLTAFKLGAFYPATPSSSSSSSTMDTINYIKQSFTRLTSKKVNLKTS